MPSIVDRRYSQTCQSARKVLHGGLTTGCFVAFVERSDRIETFVGCKLLSWRQALGRLCDFLVVEDKLVCWIR
jgi:hypothetical protein